MLKLLSDDYFLEMRFSPIPRFPPKNKYIYAAKKRERGTEYLLFPAGKY